MTDPEDNDNGYDFPTTKHPDREFFTLILFSLIFIFFIIYGIWKIFWWI